MIGFVRFHSSNVETVDTCNFDDKAMIFEYANNVCGSVFHIIMTHNKFIIQKEICIL